MAIRIIEKLFFWFMLYGFAGWLYESLLCSLEQKRFVNRGFLNGPYCPIYGAGAMLSIIIFEKVDNPFALFLLGMIMACVLEYLTSYFMEKIFRARWWDYSDKKLNLHGRVYLLGAVVFGAFTVLLIKVIHPLVIKYTERIPQHILEIVVAALLIGFIADLSITLVGFSGFNENLKKLSAFSDKLRDMSVLSAFNSAYTVFMETITKQQRRMIKAFPRLKSLTHNESLKKLRELIDFARGNGKDN